MFFRLSFIRGKITVSEFFYKLLKPKSTIVKMKICDLYITLDLSDQHLRYIYFNAYEPAERKFLNRFLKNGDVFIDVGANYGYLSAVALCSVGSAGKVYAFEPNPAVFKHLARLEERAGKRFSAHALVVSNFSTKETNETVSFYVNPDHSMLSSTLSDFAGASGTETFQVEAVTLSKFLIENGIEKPDLIKIDVEGGEGDVLEGLLPFLETRCPAAVMCEISPPAGERGKKLTEQIRSLERLGYRLNDIEADGKISAVSVDEVCSRDRQSNIIFLTGEKGQRKLA